MFIDNPLPGPLPRATLRGEENRPFIILLHVLRTGLFGTYINKSQTVGNDDQRMDDDLFVQTRSNCVETNF